MSASLAAPRFPMRPLAAASVRARDGSEEPPSGARCFQGESRGRVRLQAPAHKRFQHSSVTSADHCRPGLPVATFRSGNAAPSQDVLIRQSGPHRRKGPGQAGRLPAGMNAAPRRERRLMLSDDVAASFRQPRAQGHVGRSRASVAARRPPREPRVSAQQRSPAGKPSASPRGPRPPRSATRKPLWHNSLRCPGPPFAYARRPAAQSWLPRCRRNDRRHRNQERYGEPQHASRAPTCDATPEYRPRCCRQRHRQRAVPLQGARVPCTARRAVHACVGATPAAVTQPAR